MQLLKLLLHLVARGWVLKFFVQGGWPLTSWDVHLASTNLASYKLGCPSCFNKPTTPLKKNLSNLWVGGSASFFVCCSRALTKTSWSAILATTQTPVAPCCQGVGTQVFFQGGWPLTSWDVHLASTNQPGLFQGGIVFISCIETCC